VSEEVKRIAQSDQLLLELKQFLLKPKAKHRMVGEKTVKHSKEGPQKEDHTYCSLGCYLFSFSLVCI